MKKISILCFLICSIFVSKAQLNSLLSGMSGSGVTAAAASAAKQLQTLAGSSSSAGAAPNLSQLQLLGLDPTTIQKYITAKAGATTTGATIDPTQFMIQQMVEAKARQEAIQDSLEKEQKKTEQGNKVTPNEIFGHDFFSTGKLALYEKSAEAKAPDSYIIGVGDELNIAVWGNADYNNKFKVTDDGFIQIPEFGRIYVKGLTLGAVKAQIGKRLSTFIDPNTTKYEVTLNYVRTIEVNIVGEVKMPGTFKIPAINSVYNAVNAANGITDIGSVRDIQVRRNGKTIKRFDVYEFLFDPLSQDNFYLQQGDFIYVSTQSKIIKVVGAVRRPAKYELLKNETLTDAIQFSGGFAPEAYTKRVQISRRNADKAEIIDVDYEKAINTKGGFELKDGDIITVSTIPNGIENAVSINGSIKYAGKYELKQGFRISDIIKQAGGIRSDAYLERAYIKRKLDDNTYVNQKFSLNNILVDENSSDNLLLKQNDLIQLFSKNDFIERFSVSIDGSVLKPTTMEYTEGMTLNDLLFYAGGLRKEAARSKIDISRVINIDTTDGNGKLKPQRITVQTIEIDENLEIDETSKTFTLAPMDVVSVRKEYGFDEQMTVTLSGEVKFPGTYSILDKNETVLDIIKRAGGLTKYAFVNGAKLTRPDNDLENTIFELKEAFKDPKSRANFIVKNSDFIEIPTINQLVSIKGAVRYPGLDTSKTINGRFVPGKSARWYIKQYAGGFRKGAYKKSTLVLYPNRGVAYTHSFLGIKNYPTVDNEGATITVEMKKKAPKPPKGPESALNWNIVLPSIIAALTSVASTIALVLILKK